MRPYISPADRYENTATITADPPALTVRAHSCQGADPPVTAPLPHHDSDHAAARTFASVLLWALEMDTSTLHGDGPNIAATGPADHTPHPGRYRNHTYVTAPGADDQAIHLDRGAIGVGDHRTDFMNVDTVDLPSAADPGEADAARAFLSAALVAMGMGHYARTTK